MKTTRTKPLSAALGILFVALASASCARDADTTPKEIEAQGAPREGVESSAATALRLEQAERKLDLGRDIPAAREVFEAVVQDPLSTPEERDQARLGLSRVFEAQGDKEAAMSALEALLSEHGDSRRWPLVEATEQRLRKLVTGSESEPVEARLTEPRRVSPFASLLSSYFPKPEAGRRDIDVSTLLFGGSDEVSSRLGTFAVADAIREARQKACPTCDDKITFNTLSSRSDGWLGILRSRARLGSSLAVFYFDLGSQRIPARYDAVLPLPSAEIALRLSRGVGVIAARERPGAPPSILIAAPRKALLSTVEEALAAMTSLPKEPFEVVLPQNLQASEVQAVVRGAFPSYRACYEALLERSPSAAGNIPLTFKVETDGSVSNLGIDAAATLHDAAFEQCMLATTGGLTFPSAPSPSTVTYPIAFAPGE